MFILQHLDYRIKPSETRESIELRPKQEGAQAPRWA